MRAIKEGKHIPEDEEDENDEPDYMHKDDDEDVRLETYQGDSDEDGNSLDYDKQLDGKIKVDLVAVEPDTEDLYGRFDVCSYFSSRC